MTITHEPLLTTEHLIRECFAPADPPRAMTEDVLLDLPALAAAFARLLRDAGVHVTPSQGERYARSLGLTKPESPDALYWTTRAVFLNDVRQLPAFERVFCAVFGPRAT